MSVMNVETLRIIDRTAFCIDGRKVSLGESPYVWVITNRGAHRFEIMGGGWLRLRADPGDLARKLIEQKCADQEGVASELLHGPWDAQGTVIATPTTGRSLRTDDLGSWAAMATSYRVHDGPVTQSSVITRDMLLSAQAFGAAQQGAPVEINLGIVRYSRVTVA